MKKKFGYIVFEYFFTLAAASEFAFNLFKAFIIPDAQKSNVTALLIVSAITLLVLNLCFYNKKSAVITMAALAFPVAIAATYAVFHVNYLTANDAQAVIPYLFNIIAAGSCIVVFFAAKTRAGVLLLFLGGGGALFYMTIIGFNISRAAYFLFMLSIAIIYIRNNYMSKLRLFSGKYKGVNSLTIVAVVVAVVSLSASQMLFKGTGFRFTADSLSIDSIFAIDADKSNFAQAGMDGYQSESILGKKISPSNTTVMDVIADEPFYLKGNTYNEYTGTSWLIDNSVYPSGTLRSLAYNVPPQWYRYFWMFGYAFSSDIDTFNSVDAKNIDGYLNYYLAGKGGAEVSVKKLQVIYKSSKLSSIFLPFNYISISNYSKILQMPTGEDYSEPRLPAGTNYTLQYPEFNMSSQTVKNILENDSELNIKIQNSMSGITETSSPFGQTFDTSGEMYYDQYNKFIAHSYIDPGKTTQRVKDLAYKLTKNQVSDYDKVLAIKRYLSQGYNYTLSPKQAPKGQDFVDFFLFDSKEGYCQHFATAMTVLLREAGVPCRYVEGYAAPSSSKDGMYEVTDKQAHAWVEVYSKTLGFYTVDATPGFSYLENPMVQSLGTSSSASSNTSSSTSAGSSAAASSSSSNAASSSSGYGLNNSSFDYRRLLPYVPLLIILLAVLLIVAKRLYRVIWRGRVEKLDRKSMIIALYGHYLRVLARLGLGKGPADTPNEFALGLAAKISFGEHDFNKLTGVFVKARYGNSEPDDDDCISFKAFDRDFSRYCRKHSGLLKYLSEYLLL